MSIRNVIWTGVIAFMLCTNAPAMENVVPPGMEKVSPQGMEVVSPPGMATVELHPMERVAPLPPMKRVELPPMNRVAPPPPMARAQPSGMARHQPATKPGNSSADAYSRRRGKTIDPNGQGLNQAQIDAMERQRQLMWNATGGGMVYR